ncbi:MAG: hypothetical protein ACREMA_10980 [Longimicrobiales bacterium]
MSPVTRPDSAGASGLEFQRLLRAAANNPDPALVDWAALQRSIIRACTPVQIVPADSPAAPVEDGQ